VPRPTPPLDKYELKVPCAGECGAVASILDPPPSRPLLRAVARIYYAVELVALGWEWDGKKKVWFCKPCRVRRRMLKSV